MAFDAYRYGMRERVCSKVNCSRPAAASCAFSYSEKVVWLVDRLPELEPPYYDLCAEHADNLRVIHGWTLEDKRGTEEQPLLIAM